MQSRTRRCWRTLSARRVKRRRPLTDGAYTCAPSLLDSLLAVCAGEKVAVFAPFNACLLPTFRFRTDNIWTLKAYLVQKFGKDVSDVDRMLGITDSFDYAK